MTSTYLNSPVLSWLTCNIFSRNSLHFTRIIWLLFLSFALFAFNPLETQAAITQVGTTDTSGCVAVDDYTISRSYTTVSASNSALVVSLPFESGPGTVRVSSVSWGSIPLTRVPGTDGTTPGTFAAEIWVALFGANHTGTTNTLFVTFTDPAAGCAVISQYSGVHQVTPAHDGTATSDTLESGTASLTVSNVPLMMS